MVNIVTQMTVKLYIHWSNVGPVVPGQCLWPSQSCFARGPGWEVAQRFAARFDAKNPEDMCDFTFIWIFNWHIIFLAFHFGHRPVFWSTGTVTAAHLSSMVDRWSPDMSQVKRWNDTIWVTWKWANSLGKDAATKCHQSHLGGLSSFSLSKWQ